MDHEVRRLSHDDYAWSFREGNPGVLIGVYGVRAALDPFPAYAHDAELVESTLASVMQAWPPSTPVRYWVADREEISRSNGFACRSDYVYDEDRNQTSWTANVFMSGKRIPPHPAVTRYLVAHEYGHNVEWWLEHQRGMRVDSGEVLGEYADLRGLNMDAPHGGGHWHSDPTEIFANDFRIICAGIEAEYWPHPDTPHPFSLASTHPCFAWWDAQRAFIGPLVSSSSEAP